MKPFKVPVVLFIFKRKEKVKQIISRISAVKPEKIYIIADGPRNNEEYKVVQECRKAVEQCIDWPCEIVKNYSDTNRGVYENIGLGAKWVFEREDRALFLEDDNLPEISFFKYCEDLLERYNEDPRILWICGTNYLENYQPADHSSYVFTQHLLPCGWASWSNKFLKYYDGELNFIDNYDKTNIVKKTYLDKRLYKQQINLARMERNRILKGLKPISWDYQMEFALRVNGLYGISPKYNQIENIGVDSDSIHGGSDFSKTMTKRFCSMKTIPLEFPLIHPEKFVVDIEYDKKISNTILYPFKMRSIINTSLFLKRILKVPPEESLTLKIKNNWLVKKIMEGKNF